MKVCIGITTKNRASILVKSIQSALDQHYENKVVMVFDDGSTDETIDLKKVFPTVKWIREEVSVGYLAARNHMMRICGADFFVSLDDDAWFLVGDEIDVALGYMKTNENLAAIAFDILQAGTKRFKPIERSNPVLTNIFIGCGYMHRLEAVAKAGYYIPFPIRYGHEEKDLGIRLLDLGYDIYFLPGVHVWHDYTKLERNMTEQDRSFIINDLVFPFRRVPLIYLLPVMLHNIRRKLSYKFVGEVKTSDAIWDFLKLIPSQMKYVKRVRRKSYLKYRSISKSYLNYLSENAQS